MFGQVFVLGKGYFGFGIKPLAVRFHDASGFFIRCGSTAVT